MLRLGKRGQVRAHLDHDRARRRAIDSGDRLEQAHPVGEGLNPGLDLAPCHGHPFGERIVGVEQVAQQPAAVGVELEGERLAQRGELAGHARVERSENRWFGISPSQPVEHAPSIDTEQVRDHPSDADAASVDDLLDPIAHPASVGDELTAVAGQGPQAANLARGDVARTRQAELTHPGQPHAVGHVGLAPFELLHVLRMDQVRRDARVFERLERGNPVNSRRFERRRLDPMLPEPADQLPQPLSEGVEGPGLYHRFTAPGRTKAHRRGDLHLVNVQPRRAGMDNVKGVAHHGSSLRWVARKRGRSAGGTRTLAMRLNLPFVHGLQPGTSRGSAPQTQASFFPGTGPRPGHRQARRPPSRFRAHCPILPASVTIQAPNPRLSSHDPHRHGADHFMPSGWAGDRP